MSNCPFQLDAATNRWTCPQCGWVYPRQSQKPPKRNCPKAPDRKKAAAERLAHELAARYASGRATRSAVDIESLLTVCRRCPEFTGDGCRIYDGCDRSMPTFLTVLCDIRRHCKRWPAPEEAN